MATKRNILLVDDDLAVRQSLGQALAVENYNVVTARNNDEALQEFGRNSIDIVLLDVNLGKESGWDTFHQLTQIQPLVPVILITAFPDEKAARPVRRADAVMEKPLDLPFLFRTLDELATESPEIRNLRFNA